MFSKHNFKLVHDKIFPKKSKKFKLKQESLVTMYFRLCFWENDVNNWRGNVRKNLKTKQC